jgi:hypothetical protein
MRRTDRRELHRLAHSAYRCSEEHRAGCPALPDPRDLPEANARAEHPLDDRRVKVRRLVAQERQVAALAPVRRGILRPRLGAVRTRQEPRLGRREFRVDQFVRA